jgi:hypothetical protein
MGPLTRDVQLLGKAAMEDSITVAARALRRFNAGRPTKAKPDPPSPLAALARAVTEYQRLQALMQEEAAKAGLTYDFSDTKAALVYRTAEGKAQTEWLPDSPEGIPAFGTKILTLAPLKPVFLGVLFYQVDREKTGVNRHRFCVRQFVAGPEAENHLRAEQDKARAGDVPWLKG